MEPGVYNISIDDYHNGEGISRSRLTEYKRSAFHYYNKYLCEQPEEKKSTDIITSRNALDFGNAFHTYVLENDDYDKEYQTIPKLNRATLKGKAQYKELQEASDNKKFIDEEAQKLIEKMSKQIDAHPDARKFIDNSLYEKSMYWNDPDTGLLLKARPDIWNKNFIADLKTSGNASEKEFSKSIFKFGYHLQCGMIYLGLKELFNQEMKNFVFVVVEKDSPYGVAVYTLSEDALSKGVDEVKTLLAGIKECHDNNNWPSYQSKTICLPSFAKNKEVI